MSSSEEYIRDFNCGSVRDKGYLCEIERIAYKIEEDAAGENGASVERAMGYLRDWVDELFWNSGLDCLNNLAVKFIRRMIAEAMIAQRDQTVECFEPTGRGETVAESLAEQE